MADKILTSVPEELVNQNTLDAQTPRDIALTAIMARQENSGKQDKLTAGAGITIDKDNVISATVTETVTLDDSVTETSENGVKSSGIYDFVVEKVNQILDDAPAQFDTLKEIAEYLETHSDAFLALQEEVKSVESTAKSYTDAEVKKKQDAFTVGSNLVLQDGVLSAGSVLFSLFNIGTYTDENNSSYIGFTNVFPQPKSPYTQYIGNIIFDMYGNVGVVKSVTSSTFEVTYRCSFFKIDTEPTMDSPNLITSGAVAEALNNTMGLKTIEQEITGNADNLASSKAIKSYADAQREEAIRLANAHADALIVLDDKPTESSRNLLTSGAVHSSLATKQNVLTPGRGISIDENGVIANTIDGNGVITVPIGTANPSVITGTYIFLEK